MKRFEVFFFQKKIEFLSLQGRDPLRRSCRVCGQLRDARTVREADRVHVQGAVGDDPQALGPPQHHGGRDRLCRAAKIGAQHAPTRKVEEARSARQTRARRHPRNHRRRRPFAHRRRHHFARRARLSARATRSRWGPSQGVLVCFFDPISFLSPKGARETKGERKRAHTPSMRDQDRGPRARWTLIARARKGRSPTSLPECERDRRSLPPPRIHLPYISTPTALGSCLDETSS